MFIQLPNKSIPNRSLFDQLSGVSVTSDSIDVTLPVYHLTAQLGEDCEAFKPVYYVDNLIYKADWTNHPAELLTITGGLFGEYVRVIRVGEIEKFTDVDLYLGDKDLTDTPLSTKIVQKIVYASDNLNFINIGEPYYNE